MNGKKAHPSLGVVMIVKNEEKNLGNILGDISTFADEIVVVDTGSTDRTREIAESFGVRLGHFTWCDDFSAARNASIDLATADYLLWLDADDRIYEDSQKKLLTLKQELDPARNKAYYLKIHNVAFDHAEDTLANQMRIFPNIRQIRFEGRIHEQVLPSLARNGIITEFLDITIHHTGYPDGETSAKKGQRNLGIQLKELEAGNNNPYLYFTIALSYLSLQDYEKCLEYIREARQRSLSPDLFKYSYNVTVESLNKLERIEEAVREAKEGVAAFPGSKTMRYNLGAVYFKAEKYGEAILELQAASRMGMDIDNYPTPPIISVTLPQYLGTSLEKTGRTAEAVQEYRKSLTNNPDWVPSLMLLGRALISRHEIDEAMVHLERAYALSGGAECRDLQLILSLCRIYRFKNREADAHRICLDALAFFPDIPHILSSLVLTSVTMNDIDRLLLSLEALMNQTGLDTDREIQDASEFSSLCSEVGRALLDKGDSISAKSLADAALLLDGNSWSAHLLDADITLGDNDEKSALASLEKAIRLGAPVDVIEKRMSVLEGRQAIR